MTRPPVLQGVFALGAGFAMFEGVMKLYNLYGVQRVQANMSEGFTEPSLVHLVTRVTTTVTASAGSLQENLGGKPTLDWPQVFDFLLQQMDQLDLRIPIIITTLCVFGPVLFYLWEGKLKARKEIRCLTREGSTQTEEISQHENPNILKPQVPEASNHFCQINPAERALLQFGKSKSDSLLFGYVPMNYDSTDFHLDAEPELIGSFINSHELQKTPHRTPRRVYVNNLSEPSIASQPLPECQHKNLDIETCRETSPGSERPGTSDKGDSSFAESVTTNTFDTKKPSSIKSLCSLPSSRGSPFNTSILSSSDNHLRLQMTPSKTNTQLNSDIAYSQPFTY